MSEIQKCPKLKPFPGTSKFSLSQRPSEVPVRFLLTTHTKSSVLWMILTFFISIFYFQFQNPYFIDFIWIKGEEKKMMKDMILRYFYFLKTVIYDNPKHIVCFRKHYLRGVFQTKKIPNCGKSQRQNQNSLHFKCRLTLTWGGVWIFHIFPKFK